MLIFSLTFLLLLNNGLWIKVRRISFSLNSEVCVCNESRLEAQVLKLVVAKDKAPLCKVLLTKTSSKLCDDEIIWLVAMTPLPLLYNVRAVVTNLSVGL